MATSVAIEDNAKNTHFRSLVKVSFPQTFCTKITMPPMRKDPPTAIRYTPDTPLTWTQGTGVVLSIRKERRVMLRVDENGCREAWRTVMAAESPKG